MEKDFSDYEFEYSEIKVAAEFFEIDVVDVTVEHMADYELFKDDGD
ncbi:MAG: hypothetical protein K2P67_07450 [Gallionellaceae bacterium]|jgi:hypothetical protein|nr:hypothetical protein [Gallionellaceae bacterium]